MATKPGDYYIRLSDPVNQRLKFMKAASKETASQFLARQINIAWDNVEIGCNLAAIEAAREQYIKDQGRKPEDT